MLRRVAYALPVVRMVPGKAYTWLICGTAGTGASTCIHSHAHTFTHTVHVQEIPA